VVKLNNIYFVSCYAPPRWNLDEFASMMTAIEIELRGKRPILLTGDFNAWSRTWGSTHTDARGRIVEETLAAMDLVLLNIPGVHTFECVRGRSVIDLAFADNITASRTTWRVDQSIYTNSDHLAIIIDTESNNHQPQHITTRQRGWKGSAFDLEAFRVVWEDASLTRSTVENMSKQLATHIKRACDASMPRRRYNGKRQPAYWWTNEIANKRRACLAARRKVQRARNRPNYEELLAVYRARRKELKKAIACSKTRCFIQLRDDADTDPWGMAYKTVMK
jgi:hypothetical protein